MERLKCVQRLSGHWITIATVTAAVLGIITGIILRATTNKWTDREISYLNFVGEIYLRILKSLVLPLVVSSLITSIGSLDLKTTGNIGRQTIIYYLSTTTLATAFGLTVALIVGSGNFSGKTEHASNNMEDMKSISPIDSLLDLVRNVFPANWVEACLYQTQTVFTKVYISNDTEDFEWKVTHESVKGMNLLGIVSIASLCGIAASALHGAVPTLLTTVRQFNEISIKITSWMIYVTPLGVFTLILAQIVDVDDSNSMLGRLGIFVLITCLSLTIHAFVTLPVNPYKIMAGVGQVIATAFGTASSSATLPVTIRCMVENIKIHKSIAQFVLPLGAIVNMDGNAMYEALAVIFIAQIRNRVITIGTVLTVFVTASAASIGTASVPGSGIVTLSIN